QEIDDLKTERERIRQAKDEAQNQLTKTETEYKNLQEKLDTQKQEVENLQEKFTKEFENLANKILDQKSQKFTTSNKENIEQILNPLKEKIKTFEEKVDRTHKESIDYHSSLRQQIIGLKEMNEQMSKEAINLTKALKGDSKAQGDWGETQLEILLEKANLKNEIHYSKQGGYRDDNGKLKKPDFVVNLPGKRNLIIDSKVSLTAYEKYCSEEDENLRKLHLKNHIDSLRKHIKELSDKEYVKLYDINSPDYVLMFVPIEPALMLALSNVRDLYLEALDKNVVLVSSSTLLATLSTVSSMWRQENQKQNVLEIARQAGAMYDKFEGLLKDLINVGKKMDDAKTSYQGAMNKLYDGRGNLISRAEKLKKLGAKTQKNLPKKLIDRSKDL
ncbi:MAG: DNA recombination protein RmuC, partial [Bacteroidetes bacterium]|nr:DNA recombination protein RmuC [Bacteroidota bacterium]